MTDAALSREQRRAVFIVVTALIAVWFFNGFYLGLLAKAGMGWFWSVDVLQWLVLPGLALGFLWRRHRLTPIDYGFSLRGLGIPTHLIAAVVVFFIAGLAFAVTKALSWQLMGKPTGTFNFATVLPSGAWGTVVWLYASVTAGLVESAIFIGLPWLWLKSRSPAPSQFQFALVASLLFAVCHWEQGPHAVVGSFFCQFVLVRWYFVLRESLWAASAGHTLIDLVAFY